jgi:hypothetical protein
LNVEARIAVVAAVVVAVGLAVAALAELRPEKQLHLLLNMH